MRIRPLVGAVLAVTVATACSRSEPAATTPTVDPQAQLRAWAGEVCVSADALELAVTSIAGSLELDPAAGLDQLPTISQQVQESLGRIDTGIDGLQSVLNRAPASSSEAQDFAREVNALVDTSRRSGEQTLASLQEAANADNIFSAGLAIASAVTSARSAQSNASQAVTLMNETRSTQTGVLGEAFGTAPECS